MIPEFEIRVGDIHAAGMCSRGGREWAKLHGLSWDEFLSNGISSNRVAEIDDALAKRVIDHVRKVRGI